MTKEQLLHLLALMELFNEKYDEYIDVQIVCRRAVLETGEDFARIFNAIGQTRREMGIYPTE